MFEICRLAVHEVRPFLKLGFFRERVSAKSGEQEAEGSLTVFESNIDPTEIGLLCEVVLRKMWHSAPGSYGNIVRRLDWLPAGQSQSPQPWAYGGRRRLFDAEHAEL